MYLAMVDEEEEDEADEEEVDDTVRDAFDAPNCRRNASILR